MKKKVKNSLSSCLFMKGRLKGKLKGKNSKKKEKRTEKETGIFLPGNKLIVMSVTPSCAKDESKAKLAFKGHGELGKKQSLR